MATTVRAARATSRLTMLLRAIVKNVTAVLIMVAAVGGACWQIGLLATESTTTTTTTRDDVVGSSITHNIRDNDDGGAGGGMAVCYTGHLGTFSSVYQQNVDALKRLGIPVKYFCVVDLTDNYKDSRTGRHFTNMHTEAELTNSGLFDDIHLYQPSETITTFFPVSKPDRPPTTVDGGDGAAAVVSAPVQDDGGHFNDVLHVLDANHQCWQQVLAYEQRHGITFDWVLRTRLDMHFQVHLPPSPSPPPQHQQETEQETCSSSETSSTCGDDESKTTTEQQQQKQEVTQRRQFVHLNGFAIALVPRVLAPAYFDAVNAVDLIDHDTGFPDADHARRVCGQYAYPVESPECFLIKWLNHSGVTPSNGVYIKRRIVYPEA